VAGLLLAAGLSRWQGYDSALISDGTVKVINNDLEHIPINMNAEVNNVSAFMLRPKFNVTQQTTPGVYITSTSLQKQ